MRFSIGLLQTRCRESGSGQIYSFRAISYSVFNAYKFVADVVEELVFVCLMVPSVCGLNQI